MFSNIPMIVVTLPAVFISNELNVGIIHHGKYNYFKAYVIYNEKLTIVS
jgi:hypothetical protein